MKIGIPKEIHPQETRVAATPETVEQLLKLGFTVAIEAGAGAASNFSDDAYREEGVEIVEDTRALWAQSDIVLKVNAPEAHPALGVHEAELLQEGATLISFIWPAQNPELMERLAARKVNCAGHGQRAAHLPGAEARCAQLHGQYRRLPRGDRGRQPFRPLLHRPGDRRRQGAAGQGHGHRRRRGGTGGPRCGQQPGRHRARLRHPPGGQGAGAEHGRRVPRAGFRGGGLAVKAATPR